MEDLKRYITEDTLQVMSLYSKLLFLIIAYSNDDEYINDLISDIAEDEYSEFEERYSDLMINLLESGDYWGTLDVFTKTGKDGENPFLRGWLSIFLNKEDFQLNMCRFTIEEYLVSDLDLSDVCDIAQMELEVEGFIHNSILDEQLKKHVEGDELLPKDVFDGLADDYCYVGMVVTEVILKKTVHPFIYKLLENIGLNRFDSQSFAVAECYYAECDWYCDITQKLDELVEDTIAAIRKMKLPQKRAVMCNDIFEKLEEVSDQAILIKKIWNLKHSEVEVLL